MKRTFTSIACIALAGVLTPVLAVAAEKKSQPERVAFGQEIAVTDYVVKGKTTIVDFTSKFCPPCERISPMLDKLHAEREDVAVVKVDINRPDVRGIDWKSPVARQYELRSIPHFKIYGPDGSLTAEGDAAYEQVVAMLR